MDLLLHSVAQHQSFRVLKFFSFGWPLCSSGEQREEVSETCMPGLLEQVFRGDAGKHCTQSAVFLWSLCF